MIGKNISEALSTYIKELDTLYSMGNATEKSYRTALSGFVSDFAPKSIVIVEEPQCEVYGIPDFQLTRNNLAVSFIETKNIGDNDLKGVKANGNKEQFNRYKSALGTIVFTDYLTFLFYQNGALTQTATIGYVKNNHIVIEEGMEQAAKLQDILTTLFNAKPQKITSPSRLANIMAGKAKLTANVIQNAMASSSTNDDKELHRKMQALKDILVHDMDERQFADFYSQTIIYGMFIARIYDKTPDSFSRLKASQLIPTYSPFLKKIFGYLTLTELHPKVEWIVEDLVEIFRATDMGKVMKNYGKGTGRKDPIVNFYEYFFRQLAPKQRKESGAWFTPHPIVRYIVEAVDHILKAQLGISDGLADNSVVNNPKTGKPTHRVQILDPATGTGTFLVEVCEKIRESYKGQEGLWPEDVVKHIVPRLNGFEYLVAPYTMAHLKLSTALGLNTVPTTPDRVNVFLTNSLEESSDVPPIPFATYISDEANAANAIKNETPVMVILGNPPYNEKSANRGEWITRLMDDYKQEPGKQKQVTHSARNKKTIVKNTLEETNPKGIDNDYCKFIRLGENFVERNGEGVLAYISANTFLDAALFRGMRYNLLTTFDEIYILNLHGSLMRKEVNEHEECVFDIKVGVSINIFIRKKGRAEGSMGRVYYKDLFGTKQEKFDYLAAHSFADTDFREIQPQAPLYTFRQYDGNEEETYYAGFGIDKLMPSGVQGFTTDRDSVAINYDKEDVVKIVQDLLDNTKTDDYLRQKYHLKDGRDWQLAQARNRISKSSLWQQRITEALYRPFDKRWTLFDKALVTYPRPLIQDNILNRENIVLCVGKQGNVVGNKEWTLAFISDLPTDKNVVYRGGIYLFPLYLYDGAFRHTNFAPVIVERIEQRLGLMMQDNADTERKDGGFLPIDLLDYVYALLYSPSYRRRFHDFLQTGFPVIPYPEGKDSFFATAERGKRLRGLHLMKTIGRKDIFTSYPMSSPQFNNRVEKVTMEKTAEQTCRIYINEEQYFDNVPADAYFYNICGYQMADKYLSDRKGKRLTNEEIIHYQKMIYAIKQTIDLQEEMDS